MSTAAAHAHEEHHEYSMMPFIIGVGSFLFLLGLAFISFSAWAWIPGAIVLMAGMWGWAAEDTRDFHKQARSWKGMHIGMWGMLFFLGTEVSTFAALFVTYFVKRGAADVWPQVGVHLPVAVAAINTAILIASGFVLHYGEVQLRKGNRKGLIIGLSGAILLGVIFLALQVQEYVELIHMGLTLSSSGFGSIFYLLTGTHGFHVLLGVLILGTMLVRALAGSFDPERHIGLTAAAYYWHFVDIVWIFLFLVVYLGVI